MALDFLRMKGIDVNNVEDFRDQAHDHSFTQPPNPQINPKMAKNSQKNIKRPAKIQVLEEEEVESERRSRLAEARASEDAGVAVPENCTGCGVVLQSTDFDKIGFVAVNRIK